jgi:hypothetical protein
MKGPPQPNADNKPSFGFGQGPMEGGFQPRPFGPETEVYNYRKMQEKDNIEITKRNIIVKGDGQESGGE